MCREGEWTVRMESELPGYPDGLALYRMSTANEAVGLVRDKGLDDDQFTN